MQTILIILLVLAMIGVLYSLVRGLAAFLKQSEASLNDGNIDASLQQNKMMMRRVQFQALAIVIVVLMLVLAGGKS